jgi:glycosyltransferase involved in cell wall biosynthesis
MRTTSDSCATLHPVLSIVIPTYNIAPFIRDAVASALDQSYRGLEVIVVDDGSTDKTQAILEEFQRERNDPRLRIIYQSNKGLSGARNAGIIHARGQLIGFLDGDDIWLPDKAARHVSAMQNDRGIGISFSHSEYLSECGQRTGSILVASRARPSVQDLIRRNHVGNGSSPIVRRECFEEAGLFREDLRSCEDYEMWCRILYFTTYRAELINAALTLYRLRSSSLSYSFRTFLQNAELAVTYLQGAMPDIPTRIFAVGRAEHHRIAAWKSVSSGQTRVGLRLLLRAIAIRPALVFDLRAIFIVVACSVPVRVRMNIARSIKRAMRKHRSVV